MQIDVHLLIPRVSIAGEIDGWVYGSFVPVLGQPRTVLAAVRATRPWVKADHAVLHAGRAEDALLDFVNLRSGDTQQAVDFVKQYGPFSDGDRVSFNSQPSQLRKYWREMERSGKTPFATDLRCFWFFQERVSALLTLCRSRGKYGRAAAKQACQKINPHIKLTRPEDLTELLSYFVSQGLDQVRLGISPHHGKMIALAVAADLKSALYMVLLSYLTRGARLKDCANRKCRKVFLVTRPDRRFCTIRCQNLVKVQRFRKRRLASARP